MDAIEPIDNPIDTPAADAKPSRMNAFLLFLICFIPLFATVVFGAVDSAAWVLLSVLWALMVLLWFGGAVVTRNLAVSTSLLQVPIAGLLLLGVLQLLPLAGETIAGVETSRALSADPFATRLFVLRVVIFLTFFSAALTFIDTEGRLKKVVVLVVIFGAVMAFFGLLQRMANPDGIYGVRLTPDAVSFGPFVNQHHFAAFMQMTGGVALGLLLRRGITRDRQALLITAVVVMGVAVAFTGSRGGMLGFLTTAAFTFVLTFLAGRRKGHGNEPLAASQGLPLLAAGGLGLVVVIFGTALLLGGNDSLLRGIGAVSANVDVSTGRLHFWPIALRIFLDHPVIGAGMEAFGAAFPVYDSWNGFFRVEHAHNDYLQILADGGILGFACVAAFIVLLFRCGLRTVAAASGFRRAAAIGALAGCLGILVHSFFDFPLRTNSNAFFFLLLAVIATSRVAPEHELGHRRKSH